MIADSLIVLVPQEWICKSCKKVPVPDENEPCPECHQAAIEAWRELEQGI